MKWHFRRIIVENLGLPLWGADKIDNKKIFAAASYEDFRSYFLSLPAEKRHFYEILQPTKPTHLYVDVEYDKTCNSDLGDICVIIDKRIRVAYEVIFGLDVSDVQKIELDASNDKKYSRHFIYRMVNGQMFVNPFHCGAFMRRIQFPKAKTSKGDEILVVDFSVYTSWRLFRCVGCSKRNDPGRVLMPWNAEPNLYWTDTLVQFPTEASVGTSSSAKHLYCYESDGSEPISIGLRQASADSSLSLDEKDLPIDLIQSMQCEISEMWNNESVTYSSYDPKKHIIIFSSESHYCAQKGGEHSNNHVFFTAFLEQAIWRQSCYNTSRDTCYSDGNRQWSKSFAFVKRREEMLAFI